MKRLITTLLASAAIAGVGATPAAAQEELPKNPKHACATLAQVDPQAYAFLNTKPGGCVSSLASVGAEELMAGAFPSRAAVVGNCKTLEKSDFAAYTPEDARAYPYQFYNFFPGLVAMQVELGLLTPAQGAEALALYEDLAPQLLAENRADCVDVLRGIHSEGLLAPLFPFFPPQG